MTCCFSSLSTCIEGRERGGEGRGREGRGGGVCKRYTNTFAVRLIPININKPGLWLNLRQYLVPPSYMTPPPPPLIFESTSTMHYTVSCIPPLRHPHLIMSPCPHFPARSYPIKSRSFLKFCTTDEDPRIETSCIE